MITTSHRYAQAFFDLSKNNQWDEIVYQDLKTIDHLLDVSEELSDFCTSPVANNIQRTTLIKNIFENKINIVTVKLLEFMEEKKHLYMLKEIIAHYLEMFRNSRNIQKITIFSSRYLPQDLVDSICQQMQIKLKKSIEYESVINESLIGGLKIAVGDTIHDFSFRNQIDRFKHKILTAV